MAETTGNGNNGNGNGTKRRREWILFGFGLLIFFYEVVAVTSFGKPFHFEILLGGLACAGVGITQSFK